MDLDFIKKENVMDCCKCCLDDDNLQNLWEECLNDDQIEIFGVMLEECYSFIWENKEHNEFICNKCILRLRDALHFKREIIASKHVLQQVEKSKRENNNVNIKVKSVNDLDDYGDIEYLELGGINYCSVTEGRCKCCLDDSNLQNLWEEHFNDNQIEMFGVILEECYSFNWENTEQNEVICKKCILRLRDALNFKREIIASEHVLQQVGLQFNRNDNNVDINVECANDMDEYQDIEYLDTDGDYCGVSEAGKRQKQPKTEPVEATKRKWPKKRKGANRLKVYKKYTQLEMRQAIEAVKDGKMSLADAADLYKIPRNTLKNNITKFNASNEKKNDSNEDVSNKEKYFKVIEEIKILLRFTNATPFKTKAAKYYCAYCSTEGPVFDDGDELRIHTINLHSEHRMYDVDHFMRPYWLNEILKLDVDNLACNLCETKLPDWNGMFQHFSNQHNIEFDEAYIKVVPYIIKDNLTCVLCHEMFSNFHQLDGHMNAHYNNYICYECGDTFVAASRLEKHVQVHNKGHFPCEECGKVFSLLKYRVKHYNLVHKVNKIKCQFCSDKFPSTVLRHSHTIEKHKDKIKEYTCEFCGAMFNYKPLFIKHLQRKHINEKFKCEMCDKSFTKKYDLRNHMLRHTQNKKYVCISCGESFKKKVNFKHHFKNSHSDKAGQLTSIKNMESQKT